MELFDECDIFGIVFCFFIQYQVEERFYCVGFLSLLNFFLVYLQRQRESVYIVYMYMMLYMYVCILYFQLRVQVYDSFVLFQIIIVDLIINVLRNINFFVFFQDIYFIRISEVVSIGFRFIDIIVIDLDNVSLQFSSFFSYFDIF